MFIFKRLKIRLRRRVYGHVMLLGYNCETAFRFYRHFGFVDSGLFTWSYIPGLEVLIRVLGDLGSVFSSGVADPDPLYECLSTHILFHGREPQSVWSEPGPRDAALLAADRAELLERVEYLRGKFRAFQSDSKSKLYIVKVSAADAASPELDGRIAGLHAVLTANTTGDFDLLAVCEDKYHDCFGFTAPNFFLRSVAAFSPDDAVTDAGLGDGRGWTLVFDEFRPAYRLARKQPFKFEKD